MKLRLISDLHGNCNSINQVLQSCHFYDLSVQLGDFGVGFGAEVYLPLVDSDKFKVLHGNHDCYDILSRYPHNLGRYGILEFAGRKIFYIAGAWSIDQADRTPGLSWWSNEELSYKEANDCLDLYESNCMQIGTIISHEAPINVGLAMLGYMPHENITNKLLYEIWKIKQPEKWYFGHWHRNFSRKIGYTDFRCLNINEEIIIDY